MFSYFSNIHFFFKLPRMIQQQSMTRTLTIQHHYPMNQHCKLELKIKKKLNK